jgi:disulfide bond formation protein DsbB
LVSKQYHIHSRNPYVITITIIIIIIITTTGINLRIPKERYQYATISLKIYLHWTPTQHPISAWIRTVAAISRRCNRPWTQWGISVKEGT